MLRKSVLLSIVLAGALSAELVSPSVASGAIRITGLSGTLEDQYGDTWYKWRAPRDGRFVVSGVITDGDIGGPHIEVFSGPRTDLVPEAKSFPSYDDTSSSTDLIVSGGVLYRIFVSYWGGFSFSWRLRANPCTVTGTWGDDVLEGTVGVDYVCGLGGDDRIVASPHDDTYDGGSGTDIVSYEDSPNPIHASFWLRSSFTGGESTGWGYQTFSKVENLQGSRHADVLEGYPGDERSNACYSSNVLIGGPGDDVLAGGFANDILYGWSGNDLLVPGLADYCGVSDGAPEVEHVDGGRGRDTVSFRYWGSWPEEPFGLEVNLNRGKAWSNDGQIATLVSIENAIGTSGYRDILRGSAGRNVLRGGGGHDTLYGYAGDDRLYGQGGNDTLDGGMGTDLCRQGRGFGALVSCEL